MCWLRKLFFDWLSIPSKLISSSEENTTTENLSTVMKVPSSPVSCSPSSLKFIWVTASTTRGRQGSNSSNEAASLPFPPFFCSSESPWSRAQAEDLVCTKHHGTLAASGMAQSAHAELDAAVLGATGCLLAYPRPDDVSGKAGVDSSNPTPSVMRMGGRKWLKLHVPWSTGSIFQSSVAHSCALLLQFKFSVP